MRRKLHIGWLWSSILLMLLTACSSSDGTGEREPAMLTIYVYSPDNPMLIRAAVGNVNPTEAESRVTKLQIWIFETNTGNLVGYLNTSITDGLNTGTGASYQIPVSDDFASRKPDVDVYVLANVTEGTCGYVLNENTTRTNLQDAVLDADHFGLSSPVSVVSDDGIPMAGVLRNQPVIGDAPVLRIGSIGSIATVSLARVVSKLRFVFATTGPATLTIKDIQLNSGMIPVKGYLIPRSMSTVTYNNSEVSLLSSPVSLDGEVEDPTIYIYSGQEAQTYETLINGVGLTTIGPFYLHESDKRLTGKISYSIGDEDKESTFQMEAAGDFLRNHTWIVYGYHTGGGFLQMNTIYVKDWANKTESHEVYNW